MLVVSLVCEVVHRWSMSDVSMLDRPGLLKDIERAVHRCHVEITVAPVVYSFKNVRGGEMLAVTFSNHGAHQSSRIRDPEPLRAEQIEQVICRDVDVDTSGRAARQPQTPALSIVIS